MSPKDECYFWPLKNPRVRGNQNTSVTYASRSAFDSDPTFYFAWVAGVYLREVPSIRAHLRTRDRIALSVLDSVLSLAN